MKIFLKIFFTTILSTVILITFFVNFILKNKEDELTNRLYEKIEYLKKINQNTISQLLYNLNNEVLLTNLNALYQDKEIIKIELIDYSNSIQFNKEKKDLNNDFIKSEISLIVDNETFGKLIIWYTRDIIKNDIEEFKAHLLEFSLILLMFMSIVIFFFISKFTKSIKKLTEATNEISSGNLDYEINIKTNDEIGILADKFNDMKNSLKKRISTIDEQLKFQQLLIESVNTPIFIKDEKGVYIDCNSSFSQFYGKTKKEIIGKEMKDLISGEDLKKQIELERELFNGHGFKIFETKLPNVHNELKDLILYKNTYFDSNNKLKWIVGTYFDITEMNKAKKKIEKFNEELQQKVYERTEELEESNEELQTMIHNLNVTRDKLIESEKMASLGGLVAGVAHEINTPVGISLTAITHFVELNQELKKDFQNDTLSEEKFNEFLKTSEELALLTNANLKKTAHLIKSFKQVAVDQSNEEEKRKFNLKEYIEETLISLTSLIKKTNLIIKVDIEEQLIINSFPGLFSQIITNFITNSINHAYEEKEKGVIKISAKLTKKGLELIYKDDGKGIPKENTPKIFDPFFTTNRINGGTGLGLNIIYNIVTNNLNGSITCESEENKGVKFTISIKNI